MSNIICFLMGMLLGIPMTMTAMVLMLDARMHDPPTKEEWKVMSMDE